jgi:hypothetical protein
MRFLWPLLAVLALATPVRAATVTAGQVVSLGGALYQIAAPASGTGAPTLVPYAPLALNLGDHVTYGLGTYTVTPQLTLAPWGLPAIGSLKVAGGTLSVLGSGFGATVGKLDINGQPAIKVAAWADGEIDAPQPAVLGWVTVFRPDGQWNTLWAK